jgi:insulysin
MTITKQPPIITSELDTRKYKYLELPNKLKVLLISDDKADLAAAALNVNIGSGNDPDSRLGMAHFLEHMLFLGTDKYPKPDDYNSFITQHGGHYNAYTAFEHTNYFFDIDPSYFKDALDRFSQFFIAPLFSQEYLEREQNAVNSEYQTYIGNDDVNQMYVMKEIMNPLHPFSKFNIGSLDTLKNTPDNQLRDDVMAFYQQHYSSNIMSLVLISNDSLEHLEQQAQDYFSGIVNNDFTIDKITADLFTNTSLPSQISIKPKKDEHDLDIYFPAPIMWQHYTSKPYSYLGHMLGHEGKGSLLAWLKEQGLANGLSSGSSFRHRDHNLFNISINLTPKGVAQQTAIISKIFQFIALVEQDGIDKWRFSEMAQLSQNEFLFQEHSSTLNYALTLAGDMHYYPVEEVLHAPSVMSKYQPELINTALAYLTPDNALVILSSPLATTNKTEKWFNIPYAYTPLEKQVIDTYNIARHNSVNSKLALSIANDFIASDFSLIENTDHTTTIPCNIYNQANVQGWYQQDHKFLQPRADIFLKFATDIAHTNAYNSALTQLYVRLAIDKLDEETYLAQLAGFDYSLYHHPQGFSLKISGFNDKQDKFVNDILHKLRHAKFTTTTFERIKAVFIDRLRNQVQESPYQQTIKQVSVNLTQNLWSDAEILHALAQINLPDVEKFIARLYTQINILTLIHGNYSRSSADKLNAIVYQHLGTQQEYQNSNFTIVKLNPGSTRFEQLTNKHADSAVCLYWQAEQEDYTTQGLFELLAHIIHVPLFEDLRTQQQLGYKISAFSYMLHKLPAIAFTVESDVASAAKVYQQIRAFLAHYLSQLQEISQAEFNKHKNGLLINIRAAAKNLTQQTEKYWQQLNKQQYKFDRLELLATAIENIDAQAIAKFYTNLLDENLKRSLVVYSFGKNSKDKLDAAPYADINLESVDKLQYGSTAKL